MMWAKIINGSATNKKVEKSRLIVFTALPQQWPLFCCPVRDSMQSSPEICKTLAILSQVISSYVVAMTHVVACYLKDMPMNKAQGRNTGSITIPLSKNIPA